VATIAFTKLAESV